jgi:hypothetical protein
LSLYLKLYWKIFFGPICRNIREADKVPIVLTRLLNTNHKLLQFIQGTSVQLTQESKVKGHNTWRANQDYRVENGEDYSGWSLTTYGSRSSNPSTTSAILPAPILANRMGYRGIEEPRGCETKRKGSDADLGRRGRGGRWWWRPSSRSSRWSCRWRALGSWARPPLTPVRERFGSELDSLACGCGS